MIVSIHMPKTAGMTFGELLSRAFQKRLMLDYEDYAAFRSPEALAQCASNATRMRTRRDELIAAYDVIHGHFVADKYAGLFPDGKFIAFFRDPVRQAISHYRFLQRTTHLPHPVIKAFHDARMTPAEFIRWEATKNPQTMLLGSLPLGDLEMVGLQEEFPRSLALFTATFARPLDRGVFNNVDPSGDEAERMVDAEIRRLIGVHRAEDIDLYRRAKERFCRQAVLRGV